MKRSFLFLLFLVNVPSSFLFSQTVEKEENIVFSTPTEEEIIEVPVTQCYGGSYLSSQKEYGNEIFKIVEEMPRFPGCEDMEGTSTEKRDCANLKLLQFIQKNLQWPPSFNTSCVSGRCYVSFVVEKDGSISNIKLLRDIGAGGGAAAMEVVNEMFCQGIVWISGKQRGQSVRVQFNVPIRFCTLD